jgi:hypothetical protein
MARKTPPVPVQVVDSFWRSNARFRKRLIDFDTGSEKLEAQHITWMQKTMAIVRQSSAMHVQIVAFASKLGDAKKNKILSDKRLQSVYLFLQKQDPRTLANLEVFKSRGEEDSTGGEKDNSPEWRAVEVHIFMDAIPTPVPPNVTPVKPNVIPLPGGERFKDWAVATPGGAFVSVGVGGGFNIFFLKNVKRKELRGYIQPVGGAGWSAGLKGLRMVWNIVQQIVSGVQIAPADFTPVTPKHPVTWGEMEGCLVRVTSAGGGVLVIGGGFAVITFSSSGVWQYGPSGTPIKVAEDLFQFQSWGNNWQVGLNASVVVGPLVRVA